MLVTAAGIVMLDNEVQFSNAKLPMLVNCELAGMIMLDNEMQPKNAYSPMLVNC